MKLYMKQQVFSFRDRFYILDGAGAQRFYVEGELFSLGKRLHIFDLQGRELASVQQKLFTFLPCFQVYVGGVQKAEIVKELSLFRPRYTIHGPSWTIDGDFWDHDYAIRDRQGPVVRVSKAWLSWGDSYLLDIRPDADPVMAIAAALAIDCVLDAEQNSQT